MRKTLSPLFAALLMFLLFSCSSDDLGSDELSIETADLAATVNRSSSPCEKNLLAMVSNTNLSVDCLSDLKGQTINLPKGVNLDFDGGSLANGTLHFNGGTIDGRLLSKDLKITGNVRLLGNTYKFIPSQWGITQGKVSNSKALQNRKNIEEAIEQVKELGGDTFEVGSLDAYFEIVTVTNPNNANFYEWEEAINIPSDFHLKLSDNTKLRVQPNGNYKYALIAFDKSKNAKLSGGTLYGDRDYHKFNGGGTHEWGNLVIVHGAYNSRVENVKMTMANGDGLKIEDDGFVFESHHTPSKNITINNCVFDINRRNNLSVVGGEDIVIENSTFLRTGINTTKSKGTNPRFAIDIEAYRKRENGKIKEYERVDGVTIRNNTQSGSARGGFLISIGKNVTIENNTVEDGIGYKHSENAIIRNNTIKGKSKNSGGVAMVAGDPNGSTQKNNKIYGNKFENWRIGIVLYGDNHRVYNNELINCKYGIQGKSFNNTKIIDNTIVNNDPNSRGIFFHITSADDVEIKGNYIRTPNNPINFTFFNYESSDKNNKVSVVDNIFESTSVASIKWANNLTFKNNTMRTALEIFDSRNLVFDNNTLDAHKTGRNTIDFRGKIKNINISNNDLTAPKGKWSTNTDNEVDDNEISEWGNTWRYK